jgi:3-dehydroquinate synthase
MSKSTINFDYRVVEVPRGDLLDPSCDALLFGHLEAGSPEKKEAMSKPQRRLAVVDETVYSHIGDKIKNYFEAKGVEYDILRLNMVEDEKDMDKVLAVAEAMKKFNIDRRTEPVLAFGGGVALDIVALAASLFRRRTPYIRVPTTALSYVDASVGAKSGVNFMGSKNILGMYVPPAAALLDSAFFATESHRRIANALAEMSKMAIMKSPELFELLEDNADRLVSDKFVEQDATDGVPARVLRLSIETMLEELAPNLWESSLDRLVDYGHAIGQGLEMKSLGTRHELMHGEAVAVDMAYMAVLSNVLGLVSDGERDRILNLLRKCQVPVYNPLFTREWLHGAMAGREKFSMGQKLPLPVGIGKARIVNDVSSEELDKAFDLWKSLTA